MTTLKYGLLGCGMMGREHIRNIQLLDNTEIAAIHEPDAGMQQAARKLAPNATYVDSLSDLLAVEALDCLVIVSPNYQHANQLRQIAATRPLPLLVEKPLYTDLADEQFVTELVAGYPAPIWVAMEYRYMPPMAEFLKCVGQVTGGVSMLTIREHRFPFLRKVDDWNRFNCYTGGTLVEKCCHYFDLMRLIMQSEPVNVMTSGGQTHNHLNEVYHGETSDIWDSAYTIINFSNGRRAMLELCMFAEGSRYQEEITAVGIDGKIECKIPGPSRFWNQHLGAEPVPKIITSPRNPSGPVDIEIPVDATLLQAGDHHGSTFYQHRKFQQVVLGNSSPEVTLADGMAAVKMGMAAQESATNSTVVSLL